ncbi:hypothetical protein HS041_27535 [Planomonospora sp. ID67723]|nr:hypothetical protein [Planomonospora sp. ID67723]
MQITGQLQAVQAPYVIRTEVEVLQEEFTDASLIRLRDAQRRLPDGLRRMAVGEAPEPVSVAAQAQPLAEKLDSAIERFLTDPRDDILCRCDDGDDAAEALIENLEKLLNDSGSDPARLLGDKLHTVEETAHRVAVVAPGPVGCGSSDSVRRVEARW